MEYGRLVPGGSGAGCCPWDVALRRQSSAVLQPPAPGAIRGGQPPRTQLGLGKGPWARSWQGTRHSPVCPLVKSEGFCLCLSSRERDACVD